MGQNEGKPVSKFNDAFWKWFGDSKVVDEKGQPLVVYRGMRRVPKPDKMSTTLGRATLSFTSIPELASVYAKTHGWFGAKAQYEAGANVGAFYLSIKNPLDIRHLGATASIWDFIEAAFNWDFSEDPKPNTFTIYNASGIAQGLASRANKVEFEFESDAAFPSGVMAIQTPRDLAKAIEEAVDNEDSDHVENILALTTVDVYALADSHNVTKLLKDAGYDGIIFKDVAQAAIEHLDVPVSQLKGVDVEDESYPFDVYRPFAMTQIKSATGNDGTWDADDPDIRSNPEVKPVIAYHGTALDADKEPFNKFSTPAYFVEDKDAALDYIAAHDLSNMRGWLYKVRLTIKNPYEADSDDECFHVEEISGKLSNYDGMVCRDYRYWVALTPRQIQIISITEYRWDDESSGVVEVDSNPPTRHELETGLRRAMAAGDKKAAMALRAEIKRLRGDR